MRTTGANSRRKATIALALAALAMGGATEALAGTVYPQLTIKVKRKVEKDRISGRVKAKEPACQRNRKVKLVVHKPNRSKIKAGTVRTNRKGKWKFVPERGSAGGEFATDDTRYADPGDWLAKVRKVRAGGVTCGAGKSQRIWIG